ncbi:hypothetical protein [Rhodoplanes roseus]|uniref:hypothetical protein n=1 Tax=Rhodoplanes roseus TaxID=29409 RepID=UPI0011B5880B|nr:hypothetical protein [Rhodoplanes roseus]
MTISERRAAANRRNARHSTGPRTTAGKAQARKNATRFGIFSRLNVWSGHEVAVDQFARILLEEASHDMAWHSARDYARAQMTILRIRDARCSVLARLSECLQVIEEHSTAMDSSGTVAENHRLAPVLDDLERLASYEKRAVSQRKRLARQWTVIVEASRERHGDPPSRDP